MAFLGETCLFPQKSDSKPQVLVRRPRRKPLKLEAAAEVALEKTLEKKFVQEENEIIGTREEATVQEEEIIGA